MENIQLLKKLLDTQKSYSKIFRFTVTNERVSRNTSSFGKLNLLEEQFREPLIEHVGHLPIIATTLYPHIKNNKKINIGRVLTMLAIHDIGETVLGDVIAFKKTKEDEDKESKMALKLLDDDLDPYLLEFEKRDTFDAKFATSVDKLVPLLRDIEIPETIPERHKVHGINSKIISFKKRQYFEWDEVLLSLFDLIVDKYKDTEKK